MNVCIALCLPQIMYSCVHSQLIMPSQGMVLLRVYSFLFMRMCQIKRENHTTGDNFICFFVPNGEMISPFDLRGQSSLEAIFEYISQTQIHVQEKTVPFWTVKFGILVTH